MSQPPPPNGSPPPTAPVDTNIQIAFSQPRAGVLQIQFAVGPAAFALALPHATARGIVKAWGEALDQVDGRVVLVGAGTLVSPKSS